MKNKMRKIKTVLVPFESGQIWQLGESRLKIGLVGKRLVHYKHFTGMANASPVYLSGKDALEKLLQKHRAVLLPEAAAAAVGAKRAAPRRKALAGNGRNA